MFSPLLSTKFYIPRRESSFQRSTLVPRPRLCQQLEMGLKGKLTLVAAPAGYGKSTLLTEWIGESDSLEAESGAASVPLGTSVPTTRPADRPTYCWLSLEEGDNDPIRFWVYFIAALQSQNPSLGAEILPLLQSPEPPPLETLLTMLLNDLSTWPAQFVPGIVLVLEDYHAITLPAIHQSLAFLLDHLPPTLHLIITTRADPPLPLARLRARGQLSEIRASDLRFTGMETALFLNDRMALHLPPHEVHLLAERTEGWIAGLQLAALSLHRHGDKAGFLRSFAGDHRYILNYLIEEVLHQQPQTVQKFLLRTSILSRLRRSLCDAVLGVAPAGEAAPEHSHSSQATLEQLDAANLFLVRLDDRGQWYRYHQLFREVLQHRLRQREPEALATLHHRASVWYGQQADLVDGYEQQAYLADAIGHALLSKDFAHAAALIERAWPALWNQGAMTTLFGWMENLPADDAGDNSLWGQPGLYLSYAWGLGLTGQLAAAEHCVRQVESTLQSLEVPAAPLLLGRAAALHAMLAARRGDPAGAVVLAEQALDLIPSHAAQRCDAYYALGLARQQQGKLDAAFQAYETATQLSQNANERFLAVAAQYHTARVLMAQGSVQRAADLYQHVLRGAAPSQKEQPVLGLAHVGYGEVLYQWNDLAEAARHVDAGLAMSPRRDPTYTDGPFHRFSILARIRQAAGDREGTLAAVEQAREMAQQTGLALDMERAAALEALVRLRLGELAAAAPWAEHYARTQTETERYSYLHEFETLVFVRTLLAHNQIGQALALLTQWLPVVQDAQRQSTLIELTMLYALALREDGQTEIAMRMLAHALALAEPEGYVRLFVDEGEKMRAAMGDLLPWLDTRSDAEAFRALPAYARKLLHALDQAFPAPAERATVSPLTKQPLLDPLTNRELEILRLLEPGFTNAAIAEQLMISVSTVKTHLKRIYGKLSVKSRTQAVSQARELHLL